jgi:putative colanic acid biosysnthesis UDP-glucose lipid carrier transferase
MAAKDTIVQAGQNGERLTWIGHCLRCSGLEELPQLLNVLQGTMSLVGPRAHRPTVDVYYSKLIPEYEIRHFVRPGLTGLSQLNGYLGPSEDLKDPTSGLAGDIAYIQNWSWKKDLAILLRTTIMLFTNNAV